jgi:anti-sigma regulatory factor (Ser/Thr protein kinase)
MDVRTQSQFRETFACTPLDARRARKAITAFARTWLRGVESNDFETAVGEALANAVEHGKASQLTVDCRYRRNRIVAEIHQNGVGFLPPADIHMPPHGAPRGYGLFIMSSVLDGVEYREGGTRIRLIKRASAALPGASSAGRGR